MNIESQFQDVRNLYFPRWDKSHEWDVVYGTLEQLRGNTGYCDTDAKTVYLDRDSMEQFALAEVRAFIIHEICHDIGTAFHKRGWASRMEIAAKRADGLGEADLAVRLRRHIFAYSGNGTLEPYDHDHVLDFAFDVCQSTPNIGYDDAIKRIAKYFGYTPKKVDRDFAYVIKDVVDGIA